MNPRIAAGKVCLNSNFVPTVLITAFEPYDRWKENSSWQAVIALTRDLPEFPKVTTRLYPVDFAKAKARLAEDLAGNYDYTLHLGQSPGLSRIHLEAFGLNVGGNSQQLPDEFAPLTTDGPAAYRSQLPLDHWSVLLREANIPAQVSYHAGTFLCNAVLYLAHYYIQKQRLKTRSAFLHLPLSPGQILNERQDWPSMSSQTCADALQIILAQLAQPKLLF